MRPSLSNADKSKISDDVRSLLSSALEENNFIRCKSSNLWSTELDNFIGYIRLQRTSRFSEWPHFQINFGFTPKFSGEIEAILKDILKANQPMHETWSHRVLSPTEHHKLNTKGVYSSAEPGTWEFRCHSEVENKVQKIDTFIRNYFSDFISSETPDEAIALYGFGIINELPSQFRVLQIISFGNLKNLSRIEDCIAYYRNRNFGKRGSRFTKSVEMYGEALLSYFKNRQNDHPHSSSAL